MLLVLRRVRDTTSRPSFGLQINFPGNDRQRERQACCSGSIGEDRAPRYRRPCAHAHANRVGVQESADPARMTGNQPDPPRTGRGEMACRCMPAGCECDVRPAMPRVTAIAACRPRRVAIVHFLPRLLCDVCSGNRTMPVPRRSGDDVRCPPERGNCAALRRRIPAECVLAAGTGRTSRRRLSHDNLRKERASRARACPDKGLAVPAGSRNGGGLAEVANLKHAARGPRRTGGGRALRDKAEQWSAAFLPIGAGPFGPVCRENSPGCRHEMFHALYMPVGATDRRVPGRTIARLHGATGAAVPHRFLLSRPADARRRRTARRRGRRCRRSRRCCRDRSARARSSSGRASRARCRVRRRPC